MDSVAVLVVFGLVFAQGAHVEVEPQEALVLPDHGVTIICRRPRVPLQYCRVEIPGMQPLNLNVKLSNPDVSYYGSGLNTGECGFQIHKVSDKNNGQVKCTLGIETEATESVGTAQLIVARPPKVPELDLSRGTDAVRVYKVNDVLQASCIVRDGRPVANISWFLDDEPLFRDDLSMPTVLDLAKENLQSKVQNLTRVLQATDNGKLLKCVAYHVAYPGGVQETSRQLDVKFGPLPQGDFDKFGYTLGQPGLITVVFDANPRPIIEWDIGGEVLKERFTDQSGRITAETLQDLGRGRYEAILRIAAISKQDTVNTFTLRAYNDLSSYDYRVKISTSPEPEGIELGIGGIIGIVVSILIVILVVFVLIFARVTGRWCFSGRRESKNLGESSDTESADVRQKDSKNFSPIKLTSFFKKNKDKIASAEDLEPKIIDEDVKTPLESFPEKEEEPTEGTMVYAELDLVSPTATKPVVKDDNDKTEYAEIVYTPQEESKTA